MRRRRAPRRQAATTCSTSASRPASAVDAGASLTLTGALTTDQPWRHAFGQDWLEISRVALQLGVTLGAGPEVTMGFQGDVQIGTKDIAAALKVGLSPLPRCRSCGRT